MFKIFVNAETAAQYLNKDLQTADLVKLIETGVIDNQQKEGMLALEMEVLTASRQGIVYAHADEGRTEQYLPTALLSNNRKAVEELLKKFLQEEISSDLDGELKVRLFSDNECDLTIAFIFISDVIPSEYTDENYCFWHHCGRDADFSVLTMTSHLAETDLAKTDAVLTKVQQRLVAIDTMVANQLKAGQGTNNRLMQVLQTEQRALHDYCNQVVTQ